MQNKDFQRAVAELQFSVDAVFGVMTTDGTVIACSDSTQNGSRRESASGRNESFQKDGSTYVLFQMSAFAKYFVFVDSIDDKAFSIANVIAASMRMVAGMYEEKDDRNEFVKQLSAGGVDADTIYSKIKSNGIVNPATRYVCAFHGRQSVSSDLYNLVDSLLSDHAKDFLYVSAQKNIVLVKEAIQEHSLDDVVKRVNDFILTCHKQYDIEAVAGISEMFKDIAYLPAFDHQAEQAAAACYASDPIQSLMQYSHMGTSGLIANADEDAKKHFLEEIFSDSRLENMDDETLFTVRKLFENDLNITETSKKLFINRNTLIYRLNRIEKDTGLDLKNLDDAVYFRLALMVNNDLKKE